MTSNATKTMIRAYNRTASPSMFLSSMFKSPRENFYMTEEVELDIERDEEDIAVVITDLKTGYHVNAADIFTNKSFKPPVLKEAYPIKAFDQWNRQVGKEPFADLNFQRSAVRQSFKLFKKVENMMRRTQELQASQALQNGTIILLDETGTAAYSIDFAPKTTHFPDAATAWDGVSPTIAADLNALCNVVRSDGKRDPKVSIWGEGSFNVAIEDADFKARFDLRRLDMGTISSFDMTDKGGIYRGIVTLGNYRLDVWTYGGRWTHPTTRVSTKFWEDANVWVGDPMARFDATFGAIPRIVDMDPRVKKFLPGRISNSSGGVDLHTNGWVSKDGEQLFVGAGSRPLMIPTAIDTFGCLRTLI